MMYNFRNAYRISAKRELEKLQEIEDEKKGINKKGGTGFKMSESKRIKNRKKR